ncbi:MAG: DUF5666 domain-containing protein [Glaciecola sp.]|nr:DUF5666 domain-containing protein [Glaciecola sp.]
MRLHQISIALLSSQLLFACGGSGESASIPSAGPSPVPTAPQLTTIIKTGVITGFGSVYVDGQRFNTDNSTFNVNGQDGQSIEQLQVGMKISMSVQESDDDTQSTVNSVHYDNDVEGLVTAIDRNNQQLEVAGINIRYNDLTHFIGITESSLSVDDRIEISGYLDTDGVLIATYIELDDDVTNDANQYTSGIVNNLDVTQQTFTLQGLTVNYASANMQSIENGLKVKVEGNINAGVLIATEVELTDATFYLSLSDDDISRVEKEGIVTAIDIAANTITVDGVTYQLANNVVFEANSSIQIRDFVEIYIDPTTNQVTRVESKDGHMNTDGKIKGVITAIYTTNQIITVNGQLYTFTNMTRVEDDDDRYFSFASLNINDRVEIAFLTDSQNNHLIQRIEREDEVEYNEEWELESRTFDVDVASQTITVNGVSVVLTDGIRLVLDDVVTDLSTFLAAISDDSIASDVEIDGGFDNNGQFVVKKVELDRDYHSDDSNSDDDHYYSDQEYSDNDEQGIGYVEFEGKVSSVINETSFTLNGREIRIDSNTELELNDQRVSVTQFMTAIQVGISLEIEGTWVEGTYIYAYEAEIETGEDD